MWSKIFFPLKKPDFLAAECMNYHVTSTCMLYGAKHSLPLANLVISPSSPALAS